MNKYYLYLEHHDWEVVLDKLEEKQPKRSNYKSAKAFDKAFGDYYKLEDAESSKYHKEFYIKADTDEQAIEKAFDKIKNLLHEYNIESFRRTEPLMTNLLRAYAEDRLVEKYSAELEAEEDEDAEGENR